MINLLFRNDDKELQYTKVKCLDFWGWFLKNEKVICKKLRSGDDKIIDDISYQLRPIFPKFNGNLEFGFMIGKPCVFDLCSSNNKYIKLIAEDLIKEMPNDLKKRWEVNLVNGS